MSLRRVIIAVGLPILVALLGIKPLIRWRVSKAAEVIGVNIKVEEVSVGIGSIYLHRVHVNSGSFPHQSAIIDTARIYLSGTMKTKAIEIVGGAVSLNGAKDELESEFDQWKNQHHGSTSPKKSTPIHMSKMDVEWYLSEEREILIHGLEISRNEEANIELGADRVRIKTTGKEIKIDGFEASIDRKLAQIQRVSITESDNSHAETTAEPTTRHIKLDGWGVSIAELQAIRQTMKLDAHGVDFTSTADAVKVDCKNASFWREMNDSRVFSIENAEANLKLSDGRMDLDLSVQAITIQHRALVDREVRSKPFHLTANLEKNSESVDVKDAKLNFGLMSTMTFNAKWSKDNKNAVVTLPKTPCQELVEQIPDGMIDKVQGVELSGSIAASIEVQASRSGPRVHFGLQQDCKVAEQSLPEPIRVANLKRPFQRLAYNASGELVYVESGPGSRAWVPLNKISPFMEAAIRTTEDPGFRKNHGFDLGAIENSIRDDISTGKFLRGASTVTMQLAKNLWLTREKTLSRKFQEAILTLYLDQKLSKDEILELYLNVVEFGPGLYGVGPAANYYFETRPEFLSLGQSLYLASVMPRPKVQHFGPDGRVTDRHMQYLHALMKLMRERNTINETDYQSGVTEWVIKGEPHSERRGPDYQSVIDREPGLNINDWR